MLGLIGLRPEERRGALVAFLTVFGILSAHTLLETARDALFLARLPASRLPWVYLAIAGVAVLLALTPGRGRVKVSVAYSLSAVLGLCSVVTFAFWAVGMSQHPAALYALYIWTGIEGSLAPLEFWLVLSEKYTVTQAKRIFGFVGVGSLLGAVAGAGLGRILVSRAPASSLVLAAAILFALTALGPGLLLRAPGREAASAAAASWSAYLRQTLEMSRKNPYVRGLGGLVLVSTVALTLADYVFKSTVARNIPPAQLGSFFASLYVVLNVLGLLSQLLLSGWIFRVLGLHRALMILPVLLGMGALGLALGGGVLAALWLKGADGALRYSVHRTGTELLYVPLPDGLRSRAKPFLDVVGQRGGQALASLYLLAESTLNRGDSITAAAAAALCVVWIVWANDLKAHYFDLFRTALRDGVVKARADMPALDLGSLEALFLSLNSRDDGEVMAAMDLLVEQGRVRLVPALVLYHPEAGVVLRALEHFSRSGRTDFLPVAERLLTHANPEVRAAAVRVHTPLAGGEAHLRRASGDESPLVRATALAGLVAIEKATPDDKRMLRSMWDDGEPETTLALARAIRAEPARAFADALLHLVDSPDPEVQILAAEAMGRIGDDRFLPSLLPLLGLRQTRSAAREAFVTWGESGLAFLDEALADRSLPHELRRHLPRTLSFFEPKAAARALEKHLLPETDGVVRYKILRALNRLAADPEVVLDQEILEKATASTLEAALRLLDWRLVLLAGGEADPRRQTPGHGLLAALLHDKEANTKERLFRLLALRFRSEDMKGIHRGLLSTNPKVRAGGRELLESLLLPPVREAVLALVDDAPDDERLRRAAPFYTAPRLSYESLLGLILDQASESLRCVAAYHVGELGLTSLRPRLESFRPEETGFFLARVVERALALLTSSGGELAHA